MTHKSKFIIGLLALIFAFNIADAQLIITKYGEGSSNNKFVEFTNISSSTIDLSLVELWHASNGALWSSGQKLKLSGSLAAGKSYVICNPSAFQQVKDHANLQNSICTWNGNDAVGIVYNGVLLDAVGKNGEDPGTAWNVAGFSRATLDRTIIRKYDVTIGNKGVWPASAGTTEDDSEWYVFPMNFEYSLGEHTDFAVYNEKIVKANFSIGNLNPFKIYDVSSNKFWSATNGSALANGYGQNLTSDDWLISPSMDLSLYSKEVLEFYYAWNYGNFDAKDYLKVLYSTNYSGTGSPLAATWKELPFTPETAANYWGKSQIKLNEIEGKNVYIAFRYYSDITGAPRSWSIANINIGGYFESEKIETSYLKIFSVTPAKPIQGVPFTLEVVSTDMNGVPFPVSSDVNVTIEMLYGDGKLAGTLTRTLKQGAFKLRFPNLTSTAVGQIKIQAKVENDKSPSGDILSPIPMFIQVLPKPNLVFDIYPKGHLGSIHPQFTVTAKNPDGSINTSYDKYPVNLTISGGTYTGVVTATSNQGVATFSGIVFTQSNIYSISANGADISSSQNATVTVKPAITFNPLIVPTYFKGDGQFGERIPTWALLQISNLHPNTLYRFAARGIRELNGAMDVAYGGAGVNIQYDGQTNQLYFTSNSADVTQANNYSTFVTDATGSLKLWTNIIPTGNATFNPGSYKNVYWRVDIGSETGSVFKSCDLASNPATLLDFGTYSNEATGIYEEHISYANPTDLIALYDGNGKVISTAMVQNDGTYLATPGYTHQGPDYYANLENTNQAWASYLPNNLPSGIRKIEIYDFKGNLKKTITDDDGVWSGLNTQNPSGSSSEPINFNTPEVNLVTPGLNSSKLCTGEQNIKFTAEGANSFDLYLSVNNGAYQLISRNIDFTSEKQSNEKYIAEYLHYFATEEYTSGKTDIVPLKLKIQDTEHSQIFSEVDFKLYDTPEIISQSTERLVCLGDEISIYVTALGKDISYQWYKDGKVIEYDIPQFTISDLNYSHSGTYVCKISGLEGCGVIESKPIVVYIVSPPEITKQPQSYINAKLGLDCTFEVKVHHKGIIPPLYKDKFQWFKYTKATNDTIELVDDNNISGSKSSVLTITNLRSKDICNAGDFYFVQVEGLCGTILSNPFVISQTPDAVIKDQPKDIFCCPNTVQAIFECKAVAPTGFTLEYQWFKDGTPLQDNIKINGVKTSKLQLLDVTSSDEGNYTCEINVAGEAKKVSTTPAKITLKKLPKATTDDELSQSVKRGTNVKYTVNLVDGTEPLYIKWFYNGEVIKEGKWSEFDGDKLLTIELQGVALEQAGKYICEISNDCDKVDVKFDLIVTKWDDANDVDDSNITEFEISELYPNPVRNEATIKYFTLKSELISISLVDAQGKICSELYSGFSKCGENTIKFNVNDLNLVSGTYTCVIKSNTNVRTKKIIIIK